MLLFVQMVAEMPRGGVLGKRQGAILGVSFEGGVETGQAPGNNQKYVHNFANNFDEQIEKRNFYLACNQLVKGWKGMLFCERCLRPHFVPFGILGLTSPPIGKTWGEFKFPQVIQKN